MRPRQQEAERCAPGQDRKRFALGRLKGTHACVAFEERAALGDVERVILLEAPGVQADGDVVREVIVAGEVEIDQSRNLAAAKEDIVRKKIGMNDTGRKVLGPVGQKGVELRT